MGDFYFWCCNWCIYGSAVKSGILDPSFMWDAHTMKEKLGKIRTLLHLFFFIEAGTSCWVAQVNTQHLSFILLMLILTLCALHPGRSAQVQKGLYDTQEWKHSRGRALSLSGQATEDKHVDYVSCQLLLLLTHLYSPLQRIMSTFLWNAFPPLFIVPQQLIPELGHKYMICILALKCYNTTE